MIILILLLSGILGCIETIGKKKPPQNQLSGELNVYNWVDYFGETTIEDFEKEFGVKVNLENFEDDEEMLAAVQSDPARYDVIIASGTLIEAMRSMKLLAPIDREHIPNFKNISNNFKNPPYDPENEYSVPYMWGTSGIAVNHKYVEETENSWSILWNPEYRGKITMLINPQEIIGAALKYSGYSANSTSTEELEKAGQLLLIQKPLLRGYEDTITARDDLISEALWAAHIYSGDGVFAADKNENIEYVIPREGGFIWVDNLAIPRDSPRKYTAETFINFILRPDVSAEIANYLWYANTNEAAREFTNPEILENPALYPPEEVLEKSEFMKDVGEVSAIHNKIWAELQRTE